MTKLNAKFFDSNIQKNEKSDRKKLFEDDLECGAVRRALQPGDILTRINQDVALHQNMLRLFND